MDETQKQEMLDQQKLVREFENKKNKMRCIEIASRLQIKDSNELVKEANVLYEYLNR